MVSISGNPDYIQGSDLEPRQKLHPNFYAELRNKMRLSGLELTSFNLDGRPIYVGNHSRMYYVLENGELRFLVLGEMARVGIPQV